MYEITRRWRVGTAAAVSAVVLAACAAVPDERSSQGAASAASPSLSVPATGASSEPKRDRVTSGAGDEPRLASIRSAVYGSGGDRPSAVVLGDFGGDMFAEIVVVNAGSDRIEVLTRGKGGAYPDTRTFRVGAQGQQTAGVALGDLNLDGGLDLVAVNAASDNVLVLPNGNPPGCAGPPPPGAIVGTEGADRLVGTVQVDRIFGLGGDRRPRTGDRDRALQCPYGDDGDDVLYGGTDFDVMYGGMGDDELWSDDANRVARDDAGDILVGGAGADTFHAGEEDDVRQAEWSRARWID